MKGICPMCGHAANIFAFADEAEAKEFSRLALKWPAPMADLLLDYLRLFSPPKRALAWKRARVLLAELHTALERGTVERKGREWAAPQPNWAPAIRAVLNKQHELTLPLTSNAYLFSILANQADSAEAKAENKREAQRRTRRDRPAPTSTQPEPPRAKLPEGGLKAAVAAEGRRLRAQSKTPDPQNQ